MPDWASMVSQKNWVRTRGWLRPRSSMKRSTVFAIGRNQAADVVGGEEEDTLDAVLFLGFEGNAALALEQGIGGPGGAPEDAGGVGGGGHGVEVLVELGGIDLLGFVDGEEQIGGGTHDLGVGIAGEELEAGFAQLVHIALGGLPAAAGGDTGVEGLGDAFHVVGGLGLEGGGDGDDAPAGVTIAEEQPGKDVGLELVLAGLAGEDDDKGETEVIQDGVLDGEGDAALVGTEQDAAGVGPTEGIAADGLAEAEVRKVPATHVAGTGDGGWKPPRLGRRGIEDPQRGRCCRFKIEHWTPRGRRQTIDN